MDATLRPNNTKIMETATAPVWVQTEPGPANPAPELLLAFSNNRDYYPSLVRQHKLKLPFPFSHSLNSGRVPSVSSAFRGSKNIHQKTCLRFGTGHLRNYRACNAM